MSSSGSNKDYFPVPGNRITDDEFMEYDKLFKVLDGLKNIENGGNIEQFLIFFAIKDTKKHKELLEDSFGKDWRQMFVLTDRGWMITVEAMSKLTSRQAIVLITGFDTSVYQDSPKCWAMRILHIIIAIVIAAYTGPQNGYAAMVYWATVVINVVTTLTGRVLSKNMQLLLMVAQVVSGGFKKGKFTLNMSTATGIAGLTFKGIETYDTTVTMGKLNDINNEIDELQEEIEEEALQFEQLARFEFSGYAIQHTRMMAERNPYEFLNETYNQYSVYPNTEGNHWIQKENAT